MIWRLIKKDVLGAVEFEWNRGTQRELRLSKEQIAQLDAGKIVHTPLRGGTDFYLMKEGPQSVAEPQVNCPMCGGTGHVDRFRLYGRGGKLA